VKSSISFVRAGIVLGASLLILALSGCGQKGPLYMPKIPPDPRVSTAPASAAPVERRGAAPEAPPKPASSSQ